MNELRILVQSKLSEINNLEVTPILQNEVLEKGINYFSYNLDKFYNNSDYDNNYTYRVELTGYLKRVEDAEVNILEILDNLQDEIKEKLKELNIRCSFQDISINDGIKKIRVSGNVIYNEINNKLV